MHYRFLVTTDKDNAKTSADARAAVSHYLEDNGFVYADARWSGGLADWFVIGGRWSRTLTDCSDWAKRFRSDTEAFLKQHYLTLSGIEGIYYGDKDKETLKASAIKEVEAQWQKGLPAGYPQVPFIRDSYQQLGYDDDAQVVTGAIYETLLREYEGSEESDYHCDVQYDPVSSDFIGKKWVVVVDYHT